MVKIFFRKDNQDILLSIASNVMNNMSFDWVNIKKAHQFLMGLYQGLYQQLNCWINFKLITKLICSDRFFQTIKNIPTVGDNLLSADIDFHQSPLL